MPNKPKRPCSYPGCPRLVDGQYCEEHKRLTDKQYNLYGRDDFTKNFYKTPEWRYARKKQLEAHPFCEECLKEGKRTKATIGRTFKCKRKETERADYKAAAEADKKAIENGDFNYKGIGLETPKNS